MRRVPSAVGFLTDAVHAVHHWRLLAREIQPDREPLRNRLQRLFTKPAGPRRIELPLRLPVSVPDAYLFEVGAGQPRPGTIEPLSLKETMALKVAHREVSEVNVGHVPDARPAITRRLLTSLRLAKERELVAKAASVLRREIAGVVPPFCFKRRVVEMVAREFEVVAGPGDFKLD